MINRLTLIQKLVAMVLLPTVVLVFFAFQDMSRKRAVSHEMSRLAMLARLSVATSDLIDSLERERGLVAGLLAEDAGGDLGQYSQERDRTDQFINNFLAIMDSVVATGADQRLLEVQRDAIQAIEALRRIRAETAARRTTAIEAVPVYSDLTSVLHPTITLVSNATSDARIKSMLLSVDYLVNLRMYAGLERAGLNMACTLGEMDSGIFQAVVEVNARQATYRDLFLAHANEEHAQLLRTALDSSEAAEVTNLRGQALDALESGEMVVTAEHWWRASTAWIEMLSATGRSVSESIIATVDDLQSAANREAAVSLFLTVAAILIAVLFSTIVARNLGRSLLEASVTTHGSATQILSAAQQLAASTSETATAINQTSTTIEEIRQTSSIAASKAETTLEMANESKAATTEALDAVSQGHQSMQTIRAGVEAIASNIVELSEKTVRIGEIVETVKAIAEQSNLLAVNASIEAAKAGDHGRGFAVVASEVKTLAQRSSEATDEIRSILAEIESSSNRAVMITEQGVKKVEQGGVLIDELGQAIENLARVIEENSDVASQISLTANQQHAGIEEIDEAMRSLKAAASDNAAGAEQLEAIAEQIMVARTKIAQIVSGQRSGQEE